MTDIQKRDFNDLKQCMQNFGAAYDYDLVEKAFDLCVTAHEGQKRKTNEDYYIHPFNVAKIIVSLGLDSQSIAAALLHDVVEDTKYTLEEIKSMFGAEVALLVDGVTKIGRLNFSTKEQQQAESLRKMLIAMGQDIRVIIIKLADRLHNMRTLDAMPEQKQRDVSVETLEVYAPIAHRLGIRPVKEELEDLAIKHLDKVAYNEIEEQLSLQKSHREQILEEIKEQIAKRLAEEMPASKLSFQGRIKSIHGIYRKMYVQGKDFDEIYDVYAIRIIADTVAECYNILGIMHDMFRPIPNRFKDYISTPKPNMYQSLHTTVISRAGIPFEIQIRTFEMHHTAEFGIAAHWKYKEGTKSDARDSSADAKFAWVRQLLEIQKDLTDEEEFMRTLKIDLFGDEVFAFTPRGDVINLPTGSTPIDFAFAIHSAVGSKMMGAKVNSKIVPLDYQLVTGDIVEILTSTSVHGPSRDWLKICKTNQARSKINAWLKKEMREENIVRGKESIERELKRQGYTMTQLFHKENIDQCLKRYSFANTDDMYAAIGYGSITAAKIVTRLKEYSREAAKEEEIKTALAPLKRTSGGSSITVHGIDNCLVRISKCCMPLPGDDIVGYITKGRGVSVHRADCINLRPEVLSEEDKQRIISCYWTENQKGSYLSDIQIESTDRKGLLADITNAITDFKIGIAALNSRSLKNKMAIINLTVEIENAAQLTLVIKRLYTVPGVFNIIRLHQ